MSNKMQHTLTPKLRFPEFQDAPGWDEKQLGDFAKLINDRAGEKKYTLMSVTAGVGLVSQLEKFGREIAGDSYKNYIVIKDGDFTYNKSATKQYPQGFIAMLDGQSFGAVPNSIFICFRVKDEDVNRHFLKHIFLANFHGAWLREFISVGARAHGSLNVDANDLLKMSIKIPAINEQQKIADCLSSLDDIISTQSQKLDTLKTHKKGLLQQLFPAEGEFVPRLRFPEFQNAPEWKEKQLKNISSSIFDGTHQTPTYITEGVPFYSVENVVSGSKNKFISRDDYVVATNKNKPQKGDILLTRIGKIGYSQVVTWDYDFSVYVTLAVIKHSKSFNSHYLHYFIQSNRYQAEILHKSLLNAVPPKINMDSLRTTQILLPEIEEQEKIADCLSSLDDIISAQSQKLDTLKIHKKGLMQQLFPSGDEVQA